MADPPAPTRLQIAPGHLSILLLPILVLTVSEYLLGTFADTSVALDGLAIADTVPQVELAARYRFLSAFLFYAAVAVTLIAIFAFELYARHTRRSIAFTLVAFVAVVIISLLFSTFEPAWMSSFESYQLLGEDLYRQALGSGQVSGCAPASPLNEACDGQGAFFAMTFLLDRTNVLASVASAAVVFGMVLALARPVGANLDGPAGLRAEARALKDSVDATRRYLYLSGVLLTAGMMLVIAWMAWPGELIADPDMHLAHDKLVSAISLYRGVSYTVLILSYYMPVSLILMVRIDRFRDAVDQAGSPELAEDISGFSIERIGSLDALKAILAIISPILASAVGSFVDLSAFG